MSSTGEDEAPEDEEKKKGEDGPRKSVGRPVRRVSKYRGKQNWEKRSGTRVIN